MAFKFFAFFAFVAVAAAAPQHYYENQHDIQSYQPVVKQIVQPVIKKIVEHEEPANYDFEYAVHDDHTGDIKEQHESAKNGAISGYYTLIDADGYKRIVHYTADDVHGFNAEVSREPINGQHVVKTVQPALVKKVIAQPAIAVQKYVAAAPQYYSASAQQYHQYQQAAPAHQYYSAPAQVVSKVVAPAVTKIAATGPAYTHVSFSGPSSNYHY